MSGIRCFFASRSFRIVREKKLYTRVSLHKNRMQLPMGNFLEIKKTELISSILNEIERTKFSGVCHISSKTVSGTLVFESGKCILAKLQHKSGVEAWDELLKMSNHKIDATFSDLDEAQFERAFEINKAYRIIKSVNTTPSASHEPQNNKTPAHANSQIRVHEPQEPEQSAQTKEHPQDTSSFDQDIDTFDKLDINHVTDKIRNDCKTIVRQLDLEHLMER